ncbi:hypothetical protein U9M48_041609 [Paspalum notatum var. saurae]|uniref:DUF674 domain-containing protein n=1 Tax=Paspalum notatum var. saurae TaxID=547442 RepID=A0AAQ3UT01_PASNO
MASTNISLKLLVDNKAKKVLFAEASKEFVDFLFSLLTLPISTVVKLISPGRAAWGGCTGAWTASTPTTSSPPPTSPPCSSPGRCSRRAANASMRRPRRVTFVLPSAAAPAAAGCGSAAADDDSGGYVKGVVTYMVTDGLEVTPMSAISSITLINTFWAGKPGVELVDKFVSVGMDDGLAILKAALHSDSVLSDISLKLLVDNKTKKVLFAEAGKEFVDFVFSLLTLPIGAVVKLISAGTNVGLGSIGRLYQSVDGISASYLLPTADKSDLLQPSVLQPDGRDLLLLQGGADGDGAAPLGRFKMYTCAGRCVTVTMDAAAPCPQCKQAMAPPRWIS